jgi:hypothetical protein
MATLYEALDNNGGALHIAGNLILRPITRAHYRRWGATDNGAQRMLPGDERVPNPRIATALTNYWRTVRCQMRNADRIVPE